MFFSCGSIENLKVKLLLAVVLCSVLVGSGRQRRRRTVLPDLAEDLLDLIVISSFRRVLCVKVGGQVSLLYSSRRFLYVSGSMYCSHMV